MLNPPLTNDHCSLKPIFRTRDGGPATPSRRMDTRRGHLPDTYLSSPGSRLGKLARLSPVHGTLPKCSLGIHSGRPRMRVHPSLLPRPPVLASLTALCRGGCMEMASRGAMFRGDGSDVGGTGGNNAPFSAWYSIRNIKSSAAQPHQY